MIVRYSTWTGSTWTGSDDQKKLGRLFSHDQALGLCGLLYLVSRFRGAYRSPGDVVVYLNWQVIQVMQR